MSDSTSEYDYPDIGETCCVEGCNHSVPGLRYGYEPSTREGIACNDCWDYLDANGHWPDETPNARADTDQ